MLMPRFTALLQSVISTGFEQDGQADPVAGQVSSLTSSNNFINFCNTVPNLPLTNGKQVKTGSCNNAPMGIIAAQTAMPASKFVFPTNGANIAANTAFTITMNIKNLETGNFVNAQTNYYSAPQQVNSAGAVIGHSHFVVEQLTSMTQTTPLDNTKFAFFQGVNTAADGQGNLNVQVTAGLPAGTYRVASINAAANHQPVLVAVAQHGSLDDMTYVRSSARSCPCAPTDLLPCSLPSVVVARATRSRAAQVTVPRLVARPQRHPRLLLLRHPRLRARARLRARVLQLRRARVRPRTQAKAPLLPRARASASAASRPAV
jgi:hypothetical protein